MNNKSGKTNKGAKISTSKGGDNLVTECNPCEPIVASAKSLIKSIKDGRVRHTRAVIEKTDSSVMKSKPNNIQTNVVDDTEDPDVLDYNDGVKMDISDSEDDYSEVNLGNILAQNHLVESRWHRQSLMLKLMDMYRCGKVGHQHKRDT